MNIDVPVSDARCVEVVTNVLRLPPPLRAAASAGWVALVRCRSCDCLMNPKTRSLARETPTCFADIESCVVTCTEDLERETVAGEPKPCQKPILQDLMSLRRGCRTKVEPCRFPKVTSTYFDSHCCIAVHELSCT